MSKLVCPGFLVTLMAFSVISIATTGCIPGLIGFVPTPGALEANSPRANIANEVIEAFKPRETTRLDVLIRLGDPTERIADDRFFIYEWHTVDAIFAVNLIAGVYSAPVAGTVHFLCFEFGPDNRLVQLREFEGDTPSDTRKEILQWIEARLIGTDESDVLRTDPEM